MRRPHGRRRGLHRCGNDVLPDEVIACHMKVQHAMLPLGSVQLKGNVVGVEPALAIRYQHAEGVVLDQVMENLRSGFIEMRRDIDHSTAKA